MPDRHRLGRVVGAERDDIAAEVIVAFYLEGDDETLPPRIVRMKFAVANELRQMANKWTVSWQSAVWAGGRFAPSKREQEKRRLTRTRSRSRWASTKPAAKVRVWLSALIINEQNGTAAGEQFCQGGRSPPCNGVYR
jgi:hypothetical protein